MLYKFFWLRKKIVWYFERTVVITVSHHPQWQAQFLYADRVLKASKIIAHRPAQFWYNSQTDLAHETRCSSHQLCTCTLLAHLHRGGMSMWEHWLHSSPPYRSASTPTCIQHFHDWEKWQSVLQVISPVSVKFCCGQSSSLRINTKWFTTWFNLWRSFHVTVWYNHSWDFYDSWPYFICYLFIMLKLSGTS